MSSFIDGTTRGIRIGFTGFLLAVIGAAVAVLGITIESHWVSIFGFFSVVAGVLIGFIGIVWGWIEIGLKLFTPRRQTESNIQPQIGSLISVLKSMRSRVFVENTKQGLRIAAIGIICIALGILVGDLEHLLTSTWAQVASKYMIEIGIATAVIGTLYICVLLLKSSLKKLKKS